MSKIKSDFTNAYRDLASAVGNSHIWLTLGWNDVNGRYNRSKLGVLWASLSVLIFISVLGPIYSRIMGIALTDYILHILLGFIVWSFLSSTILESCREFTNGANYLVSFQLSYFTLLLRTVWRNMVVFAYQMIVFFLYIIILQHEPKLVWITAPLGLILIALNALWIGLLVSVFATRFRDFGELLNNIMRLAFFATPVLWMPAQKADLGIIADLNPFYHLIEVFREPLLNGQVNLTSWAVTTLMAVCGWAIAFPVFARYRSRIAFWL